MLSWKYYGFNFLINETFIKFELSSRFTQQEAFKADHTIQTWTIPYELFYWFTLPTPYLFLSKCAKEYLGVSSKHFLSVF